MAEEHLVKNKFCKGCRYYKSLSNSGSRYEANKWCSYNFEHRTTYKVRPSACKFKDKKKPRCRRWQTDEKS